MRRRDLDVPFKDREAARRHGARWDRERHCWFVPEGVDCSPLLGWSRAGEFINARAHSYYLLETLHPCSQCGRESRVHGIVLPTGHEIRMHGEDPDSDEWERADEPSLISFVTNLASAVSLRIQQDSLLYRPRHSFADTTCYHYNHCEYCGSVFDEYALFGMPGYGFDVLSEMQAARILVSAVRAGFAGAAEHFSYGVAFLDAMTRR